MGAGRQAPHGRNRALPNPSVAVLESMSESWKRRVVSSKPHAQPAQNRSVARSRQEKLERQTRSAVLSASSELASLFKTSAREPTSRASTSLQPESQSSYGSVFLQSPVAVIVESTCFTFTNGGLPVDIVVMWWSSLNR